LMCHPPPRPSPLSLHDALPISANTPLSQLADLPIDINIEEDTEQFTPMTSRIAHLMVIDMLAVAVTQRRGPEFITHLNAIKRSIDRKSTRLNSSHVKISYAVFC